MRANVGKFGSRDQTALGAAARGVSIDPPFRLVLPYSFTAPVIDET